MDLDPFDLRVWEFCEMIWFFFFFGSYLLLNVILLFRDLICDACGFDSGLIRGFGIEGLDFDPRI